MSEKVLTTEIAEQFLQDHESVDLDDFATISEAAADTSVFNVTKCSFGLDLLDICVKDILNKFGTRHHLST